MLITITIDYPGATVNEALFSLCKELLSMDDTMYQSKDIIELTSYEMGVIIEIEK